MVKANLNNTYSTTNMKTRMEKFHGYPKELSDFLSQSIYCKEFLKTQDYKNWIEMYSKHGAHCSLIGRISKEYILLSFAHILNELKKLEELQLEYYINDTPSVLHDVIVQARKIKGWNLDGQSALGLCSKIICDYMADKIKVGSDNPRHDLYKDDVIVIKQTSKTSALEQILSNYSENVLDSVHDPVWDWFYNELKFLGQEEATDEELHEKYDIKSMKTAVRERKLLPNFYVNMRP